MRFTFLRQRQGPAQRRPEEGADAVHVSATTAGPAQRRIEEGADAVHVSATTAGPAQRKLHEDDDAVHVSATTAGAGATEARGGRRCGSRFCDNGAGADAGALARAVHGAPAERCRPFSPDTVCGMAGPGEAVSQKPEPREHRAGTAVAAAGGPGLRAERASRRSAGGDARARGDAGGDARARGDAGASARGRPPRRLSQKRERGLRRELDDLAARAFAAEAVGQKALSRGGVGRLGEVPALDHVAAEAAELVELVGPLDALGDE